MQNALQHIKQLVTAIAVTLFFACNSNYNEVQKIGISQNEPIGIAEDINLKRTDSGRVVANLLSPKMIDFSNQAYPFTEFPDGITLYHYDKDNNKSTIIADYAISYDESNIIDLQGNVILTSHKKDTLFADQLFYNQDKEWVFTNLPVRHKQGINITTGKGFDASRDFTKAQVLEYTGMYSVNN